MSVQFSQWRKLFIAVLIGGAFLVLQSGSSAQTKKSGFNEREIEPQAHAFDKPDNWTLTFRFKDPRIISCDIPGERKKKIVWYMLYQVINNTGEPRFFYPSIELKTHDYETVHPDEIMPVVQKKISEIEDPTGKLDIKNSVTIGKEPIPVSLKDAFPRAVNGVAIWTDVYDRAPKTNRFSIFIKGLSDGWREDPKTKIVRHKTLQINFQRLGDDIQNDANAIRWVDNPKWIYRASEEKIVEAVKDKDKPKEEPKEKALLPMLQPLPRENVALPLPVKQ